jgi:hypothetical protein
VPKRRRRRVAFLSHRDRRRLWLSLGSTRFARDATWRASREAADLDLFGEMSYLSGKPATGTVKAQTPMRYVWNKEELSRLGRSYRSQPGGLWAKWHVTNLRRLTVALEPCSQIFAGDGGSPVTKNTVFL